MDILKYPHDNLRVIAKSVEKIMPEFRETAKEMYKTMKEAGGIGLAATQVGLDISLLVLEDSGKSLVMFNPKTLKQSFEKEVDREGCLSFPGEFIKVRRALHVDVKYRDINGKMQFKKLSGLQARAYLHEADHLQGKLMIDHETSN